MKELYNLAKNLKSLRKGFGYTQQFVADSIGIKYSSYHAYEVGRTVPTLQNFVKLAKLYDVSLDELIE
ncbi:MAG: helix-turn-helix domain-containing protein [Clostridiales bacterium]|nr:helix-turn-helix domain-containing protein [Clostridiales bacterium]